MPLYFYLLGGEIQVKLVMSVNQTLETNNLSVHNCIIMAYPNWFRVSYLGGNSSFKYDPEKLGMKMKDEEKIDEKNDGS